MTWYFLWVLGDICKCSGTLSGGQISLVGTLSEGQVTRSNKEKNHAMPKLSCRMFRE